MGGDKDRVIVASRFADGTPAQTEDFVYIGDKDVSIAATERQLAEQRVSAEDVRLRGAAAPASDDGSEPDAAVKPLVDAHEKAAKSAAKDAKAHVNERFASAEDLQGKANPAAPRGSASDEARPADGADDAPKS